MITVLHLLGATCVGKSTIINILKSNNSIGFVEVGNKLRKKYLEPSSPFYDPDFFKGQANPKHTADEAWSLYTDGIEEERAEKSSIITDGNPRDSEQTARTLEYWSKRSKLYVRVLYIFLHASEEARLKRAYDSRTGDSLELAKRRITNDYRNCYEVMVELTKNNVMFSVIDTEKFSPTEVASMLEYKLRF